MAKIVVALGGNALGETPREQLEKVRQAASVLVKMIGPKDSVMLVHGNGPQVGMISAAFSESSTRLSSIPEMPLAEATALSQGYIGYHLQQAMNTELARSGSGRSCTTVVTEVLVDGDDPAFTNPTKPIGSFVTREVAQQAMAADPTLVYKDDAGRGWRQFVASPQPQKMLQHEAVVTLLEAGQVVITGGGGGIPVVETEQGVAGVQAVIDKDLTAAKLATNWGADLLLILTEAPNVALYWDTPQQEDLGQVGAEELAVYLEQGMFAEGSMKPKVEAALSFVTGGDGRKAVIGSLHEAAEVVAGKAGTIIG